MLPGIPLFGERRRPLERGLIWNKTEIESGEKFRTTLRSILTRIVNGREQRKGPD